MHINANMPLSKQLSQLDHRLRSHYEILQHTKHSTLQFPAASRASEPVKAAFVPTWTCAVTKPVLIVYDMSVLLRHHPGFRALLPLPLLYRV